MDRRRRSTARRCLSPAPWIAQGFAVDDLKRSEGGVGHGWRGCKLSSVTTNVQEICLEFNHQQYGDISLLVDI